MRTWTLTLAFSVALLPALAQRGRYSINAETPEGGMLQQAAQEGDDAKRIALYGEYLQKYPQHAGVYYALSQVQPLYLKAGLFDKVIQAGEQALALEPASPVLAYNALQAAEKKQDIAGMKAWVTRTIEAATKLKALPKPEDEDEQENWKNAVDFATQVIPRAEYSLYAGALTATDPKVTVELGEALEKTNPESQYLPQLSARYFLALQQTGQKDRAVAAAEKAIAREQSNEDMLMIAASHYMEESHKNPDKVLLYSAKLVDVMTAKPVPEGVAAADWEKRKNAMIGLGHWMAGMTYGGQSKWAQADKAMKTALPYIENNNDLLAPALFFLGMSNFRMGDGPRGNRALLPSARAYFTRCAAIKGPYQAQAQKNLSTMGPATR